MLTRSTDSRGNRCDADNGMRAYRYIGHRVCCGREGCALIPKGALQGRAGGVNA